MPCTFFAQEIQEIFILNTVNFTLPALFITYLHRPEPANLIQPKNAMLLRLSS